MPRERSFFASDNGHRKLEEKMLNQGYTTSVC